MYCVSVYRVGGEECYLAYLIYRWIQQIYHSNCSIKAAAILISRGVSFRLLFTIVEREVRNVILVGKIHSIPITLLNIYRANKDDPDFFRKILKLIFPVLT